jgi:hypothetical protein
MNRSTRAARLGMAFASLSVLSLSQPLRATTNLIGCPAATGGGDLITRAFYIPNYPGVDLKNLTLSFSSSTSGRFVLTLTAHLDTFDGPVLGSAVNSIDLIAGAPSSTNLTFVFADFAPLPIPKGRTIAFVVNGQGTGSEALSLGTGASGGCGGVETNDATPPLSSVRGSVPLTLTGDAEAGGLVTNATFDTSVAGWAVNTINGYPGTLALGSGDADGSATSGSAVVTSTETTASSVNTFVQACSPNTGAGTYSFGGKIKVDQIQTAPGAGLFVLGAYTTPDCSGGNLLIYAQSPAPPPDGAWHEESFFYAIPATVKSLALLLTVEKDSTFGTFQASFDDVFLRAAQIATLTVVGTASIHGQAGSFFHTDLWVLNRSFTQSLAVTANLHCFAGLPCGLGTASFTLQPREQTLYSDVLSSLIGASGTAGTLELSWDSAAGEISASARTYSPSAPAPTNGTGVPALAPNESRARAVFTGLASNGGDLTAGFRSNVGAYNPSAVPTTVTFALFDATGLLLGTTSHTTAAFEAFQLNDIFATVGSPSTVAQAATLVVSSNVPIFSFVTVIDNRTNDSSFLLPTDDELQP